MKISILLVLFGLFSMSLFSQNVQNIRGKVIDWDTKQALVGAQIVVLESNPIIGAVSDPNGNFSIEAVSCGRISLKVSFIGYHDKVFNQIELHPGKELVLEVGLTEKVYSAAMVEIVGTIDKQRAKNDLALVSARTFSVEETKRYAGSMGDPSRMAQNFAGVMSAGDARNDIIIRGNSPMGLLWRLEGIDIPNPNHFGASGTTGGPVTILNNNLLANSDFFTGAFPAEYGNALSGAFDLEMRNGNRNNHEFIGQIGFNGFELAAEGPFKNNYDGSYLFSYRYSTLAVIDAIGLKAMVGSSVPQYQDLTFKLNLPTNHFGRWIIFGIGGKSYIQIYDSEKDDDEFSYGLSGTDTDFGSDMGVIGLSNILFPTKNSRIKTNFVISGQRVFTKIDSLDRSNMSKSKFLRSFNNEVRYGVSSHFTQKLNARNVLKSGVIFDFYQISYVDSLFLESENRIRLMSNFNGDFGLSQAYLQIKHRFTDELSLVAGMHFQYSTLNQKLSSEPRAAVEYAFAKKHQLSFGYGLHSQMQPKTVYFVETELADGSLIRTNEKLDFSKNSQFVGGYSLSLSKNLRLKSEAYYQNLYHIPVSPNLPNYSVLNEGAYFNISRIDSLVNNGTGTNYGVELTIEKFMSKNYYFLITASLFESNYQGYNGKTHNSAFNNNFVVNLLGGYEWKVNSHMLITFDSRLVYAGGNRVLPIDVVQSLAANTAVYDWENAYNQRLDDYFRADLKIGLRLNGKKISQEWALDIQNITNHQNVFLQYWNTHKKEMAVDYQQGFFPMMFYRIYF